MDVDALDCKTRKMGEEKAITWAGMESSVKRLLGGVKLGLSGELSVRVGPCRCGGSLSLWLCWWGSWQWDLCLALGSIGSIVK